MKYDDETLNKITQAYEESDEEDNLDNIMLGYLEMMKNGSKIHIKKKNIGKFTATKKATGKTTEELTHSKNPITRKRAVFALNSRKWNKGKK